MPSDATKLTKSLVDALPTRSADYFAWDTELKGFGCRVWPSGRRSFVYKYSSGGRGGRTHRITLGDWPALTVDAARKLAAQRRVQVQQGGDPMADRRAMRQAARARPVLVSVADLFDAFVVETRAKRRPRTAAEYERLLGAPLAKQGPNKGKPRTGEIRKALGERRVAEVTRADIGALHRSMADRPILANRCVAILRACFEFAEREGWRIEGTNPCRGVTEYEEVSRERFLNDAEFAALGAALRRAEREGLPLPATITKSTASATTVKHRAKSTAGKLAAPNAYAVAALRFLLLTGWRRSEALTLKWENLDQARSQITLTRTKTGKSVRDVGSPVWTLLDDLRERSGGPTSGFVFLGAREDSSYQGVARVWAAVRHAAGLDDVRLHDLRHTHASVGAAQGLTLPMIGALLGHLDMASTNRYTHLADSARRRAADTVASTIHDALSEQGDSSKSEETKTVIPFQRRA